MSKIKKSVLGGVIGFLYAVVYGFWTLLSTGGGHGSLIWLMLFLFIEFFGLYFPLMGILLVNLNSYFGKIAFAGLILFNLLASTILIYGWGTDSDSEKLGSFNRFIQVNGFAAFLLSLALHYLPTLFFTSWLIWTIVRDRNNPANDELINLKLV